MIFWSSDFDTTVISLYRKKLVNFIGVCLLDQLTCISYIIKNLEAIYGG